MPKASKKVELVLLELLNAPGATEREAVDAAERFYPNDERGKERTAIARSRGLLAERVEALAVRLATALNDHELACRLAEIVRTRHLASVQRSPVPVLEEPRPRPRRVFVSAEQMATDVQAVLGKDGAR